MISCCFVRPLQNLIPSLLPVRMSDRYDYNLDLDQIVVEHRNAIRNRNVGAISSTVLKAGQRVSKIAIVNEILSESGEHHHFRYLHFGVESVPRAKLLEVVVTVRLGLVPRAGVEPARPCTEIHYAIPVVGDVASNNCVTIHLGGMIWNPESIF